MWRADVNKRRRTDDALRGSNADDAMRVSNADDALRVSVTRALVSTFSQILRRRPLSAALEEETKAHAVRFLEASFESEEGAYARRITSVLCLLAEADEEPRHIEQAAKPTERAKPPGGAQSPPELSGDSRGESRGESSGESPTEPSGALAFSALRRLAFGSARVAAAQAFALAACCRGTAALEAEAVPLIERLEALAHGAPADDGGGAAAANDGGGAAGASDAAGGRGEAARIGQMLAAILRRAPVMEVHMERICRATQRAAQHEHPSVLTPLLRACWAACWAVRLGEGAFSGRGSAIQGRRARGEGWGGATAIALEGLVSMRLSMRLGGSVAYMLACEAMQAGEPRCAYALLEGLEGGSALSPQARFEALSLGDSAISPTAAVDPSLPAPYLHPILAILAPHTCQIAAVDPSLPAPYLHPILAILAPHTCQIAAFDPSLPTPYLHPILAILAPHTCQISDLIFPPPFLPIFPISPTRTFRIFSTRTCVRSPIPNLAHRTRNGSCTPYLPYLHPILAQNSHWILGLLELSRAEASLCDCDAGSLSDALNALSHARASCLKATMHLRATAAHTAADAQTAAAAIRPRPTHSESPPPVAAPWLRFQVFVFAHPPISPICRTPLFPYLTFYSEPWLRFQLELVRLRGEQLEQLAGK